MHDQSTHADPEDYSSVFFRNFGNPSMFRGCWEKANVIQFSSSEKLDGHLPVFVFVCVCFCVCVSLCSRTSNCDSSTFDPIPPATFQIVAVKQIPRVSTKARSFDQNLKKSPRVTTVPTLLHSPSSSRIPPVLSSPFLLLQQTQLLTIQRPSAPPQQNLFNKRDGSE